MIEITRKVVREKRIQDKGLRKATLQLEKRRENWQRSLKGTSPKLENQEPRVEASGWPLVGTLLQVDSASQREGY